MSLHLVIAGIMNKEPTESRKSWLEKLFGSHQTQSGQQYSSLDIWAPISTAFAVGFAMIAMIVVFMLAGWWIDGLVGTAPLFAIIGILVGVAGGFWYAYRLIMEAAPDSQNKSEIEKQSQCENITNSETESSE